jgi:Sulfotransferase domain
MPVFGLRRKNQMNVLTRIAYVLNYLLSRDIAGRTVAKFPDDNFLVAYPGSGGQWLRRLMANAMYPEHPATDANIVQRVPDLYHVSRRRLNSMARPRVIFSHECFDTDCHGRVVYLIRDPRDVAVSIYEQERRRGIAAGSIEQFVSTAFMETEKHRGGWAEDFSGAIEQNDGFMYLSRLKEEFLGTPASWGENVMSWLGAHEGDSEGLLTIGYEDLFERPESVLDRISVFLDFRFSGERIRTAVDVSRASQTDDWPPQPGQWKKALPSSSTKLIEAAWGELMVLLGYPVSVNYSRV